jgi:NADH:ubiquinone oxidoreductase subunit E
MNPIEVVICTGTACYVMGAAALLEIQEELEPQLAQRIRLSGSPCMGLCRSSDHSCAPCAKVNDTVITDATIEKLTAAIRALAL